MTRCNNGSRRPHRRKHFRIRLWSLEVPMMIVAGAVLIWLVLTKSLPFALAGASPELALRLDPGNPLALAALAERAQAELAKLDKQPEEPAHERAIAQTTDHAATRAIPLPPNAREDISTARQAELRRQIIGLARRLIASDPLNPRGFRLLAEMSDAPAMKRQLMQEAVTRSRRESVAVFWLMTDSFQRGDFADVVEKADILLKTRANLSPEVMIYLAAVAVDPEGRLVLARQLAGRPEWRGQFLRSLPRLVHYAGDAYEAMADVNDLGGEIVPSELAPYLNVLIGAGLVPYAKEVMDALLASQAEPVPALLVNGRFAAEPSGLPFDWSLQSGRNVHAEFAPLPDHSDARSLRFIFGAGRATFPELSQILVLPPGRYRLDGEHSGSLTTQRGLRWEVRCFKGRELASTALIRGDRRPSWQPFRLEIEVPDHDECQAQQLRLFLDARLAAEQLVSGQIAFRLLTLKRSDG